MTNRGRSVAWIVAALAGGVASAAWAQPPTRSQQDSDGHTHTTTGGAAQPPTGGEGAAVTPPQGTIPYKSLVEKDKDGKVVRIEGNLDLMALQRNATVGETTWALVAPHIKDWMAEMDQVVIDNLDFIKQIEDGAFEQADPSNLKKIKVLAEMTTQLTGPGPLTGYLQHVGALTATQAAQNQTISSEYHTAIYNEINADCQAKGMNPQQTAEQMMKFIYELMVRDAFDSYHRQLDRGAPFVAEALRGLSDIEDQRMKDATKAAAGVKSAKTRKERIESMRKVLDTLTFAQKRALMQKIHELAPRFDPLADIKMEAHADQGAFTVPK